MLKSSKRFILHTDGLNSLGFRMLTSGAKMEDFLRNPVLLFNHIRPKGNDRNQILPLGYWEDIKVEDGQISAVPVFDEKDAFAKSIYEKVESGVIKMASMGAEPLTTSTDPALVLEGQTKETVIEWLPKEASLCDIGANPEALTVALYDHDNNIVTLADCAIKTIPSSIKQPMKKNEKTAAALVKKKLVELSATLVTELKDSDTKVVAALEKNLVKLADDIEKKMSSEDPEKELADDPETAITGDGDKDAIIAELKKQIEELKAKLEAKTSPEAELAETTEDESKETKLAAAALKLGKIRLNEVSSIIKLAKDDYEGTVKMLKEKKAEPSIKSKMDKANEGAESRVVELSKKGWDELFKENGSLEFLKLNAPDVYTAKFKAKFNKEPKDLKS